MATEADATTGLTLDEFLRLPGIDDPPYLEFVDGEIIAKVSPQQKHSRLSGKILVRLNAFAEPAGLGEAFIELRRTFAGRSILPDVSFVKAEHLSADARGEIADDHQGPPDVHIEIVSPDQTKRDAHRNLLHSVAHGCTLGILIHPYRRTIDVYRPGAAPERLADDGAIDFAPALPGLILPVAEVFGWLAQPPRGADPR